MGLSKWTWFCRYGPYSQTQYTWQMVDRIVYGAMFRLVWAIALAWVIFACHNNWGGKSKLGEYMLKFKNNRIIIAPKIVFKSCGSSVRLTKDRNDR